MAKLQQFFERATLSPTNYWVSLVCDALLALTFLIIGMVRFRGSWLAALLALAFGLSTWGFLEYALHRWVLHGPLLLPKRGHAEHHVDATKLISTPALIIGCLAASLCLLLRNVIDDGLASLIVFGIYAGYNYFALLHHLQHHKAGRMARFSYFRQLGRLHEVHHRNASVNYGTTTLLWDRLLGTFQEDFSSTMRS